MSTKPLQVGIAAETVDIPARMLSDVLVNDGGRSGPAAPVSLALAGDDEVRLLAAVALAQARLTGQRSVTLRRVGIDGDARWQASTVRLEVDDGEHLSAWRAAIQRQLDDPSGIDATQHGAEIATGRVGLLRQPDELVAIGLVDGVLRVDADPARVDALAAAALCEAITQLWQQLGGRDDCRLGTLSLLSPEQRANLLCRFQNTRTRRPRGVSIIGRLGAVVERHGEQAAIVHRERQLGYRELWRRSGVLAAALLQRGVQPGDVVAIHARRSIGQLLAITAVLRAGAAYMPLDERLPAARMRLMVEESRARCVLLAGDLPVPDVGVDCLPIEMLEEAGSGGNVQVELPAVSDSARAYVMYTSGSSGRPKGVEVLHRSVLRVVCGVEYAALGPGVRVLYVSPLSFDLSVFDIWGALLNGGTCVVHDETVPTTAGLARTIADGAVRVAMLSSPLANRVIDEDPRAFAPLQQLLLGGEAPSADHVRRAQRMLPGLRFINAYGPTECTVLATTHELVDPVPEHWRTLPIGLPLAETTAHVLAADGGLLPIGVVGEIHLGGCGVAVGYLEQPELTARAFIADPFGGPGQRLYRTGDYGRRLPDGSLEYLGRIDGQVKIRGFRIELAEVEHALREASGLPTVAVVAREDRPGDKRLVAYLQCDDVAIDHGRLRDALARQLPDYMLPSAFVTLPAFPLNHNGKLDRARLPAPGNTRPTLRQPYEAARGALEQRLCAAFSAVLGIEPVGRHDNFFELGGDSLQATRLIAALQADGGPALDVPQFFRGPTAAQLATQQASAAAQPFAGDRRAGRHRSPVPEPIAVIAMAGRFPGADDPESFWDNLLAGRESIRRFTDEELARYVPEALRATPGYVAARGVIDGVELFDARFFGIPDREAALMDPQHRIFMELCWHCLERGGHAPGDGDGLRTGVFAGMWNATYLQNHLRGQPESTGFGEFQTMLVNEKDYLPTRVAHRLDLRGPAISVQTACSTSLVAVCQAIDSLRAGHCERALAGGVSVTCPPQSGYLHQPGSMLSPDGHTRSFDAAAGGTVFCDGAAVVLLRRLSDAIADGDPIHAVLLGAAVNNDGAARASFSAPSVDGQAQVIRAALADAGVSAADISYVEAHGTATPFGDPVEVAALTRAFADDSESHGGCRLGSVKSNVGHLVAAAGAAGLIKTVFALEHGVLPGTLHFERPNPHFALQHGPFRVDAVPTPWPRIEGAPRRAGVTSLGVGGTNAHVIVEEAPLRPLSDPADGPQLLVLSAHTPTSLTAAARQLATWLEAEPDINLADVAHTLRVGRRALAVRGSVVAETTDEAARLLRNAADGWSGRPAAEAASGVVFMFPGQGAHYAGMGRALYEADPAFRASFDACADLLAADADIDLRTLFGPDGAAPALASTAFAQPAMFAVEISLARMWQAAGIVPEAVIGHSIGEYAAAVVAGVMSCEDALRLLWRRGAIVKQQPAGAMLAVRLPAAQLQRRLDAALSIAAENAPDACVASGPLAQIEALQAALQVDGITCIRLHASHAFHSPMMTGAMAPFSEVLAAVALQRPTLRFQSSRLSAAADHELTDPAYWVKHLRDPVRFGPALAGLLDGQRRLLLEVGPRSTLCALAAAQPSSLVDAIGTLADSPARERRSVLAAAGRLWERGVPLDLGRHDGRTRKRRLQLPTTVFERSRYWIDPPSVTSVRVEQADPGEHAAADQALLPASSTAAAVADPRTALRAELAGLLGEVAGIDGELLDDHCSLLELGLDSLAMTQLSLRLNQRFGTRIGFRDLMRDCGRIGALLALLESSRAPAALSVCNAAAAVPAASQTTAVRDELATALPVGQAADAANDDLGLDRHRAAIAQFAERYNARTAGSKAAVERCRAQLADPRLASGFRPAFKELVYPLVVERSSGARIWDVDGNEYIDAANGFGMNMFGWQPRFVVDALRRQIDHGYEIGPQHVLAGEVAERICAMTGFERAALCNTGSEAVLAALRIARTVTGRQRVVIFDGSYHGVFDEVLVRGGRDGRARPAVAGLPDHSADQVLLLEHGSERSLQVIREQGASIAAVLVEPVRSRHPEQHSRRFLAGVIEAARAVGAVSIFDEVVTGFRCAPGGARQYFAVEPDLATYGKVLGGGLPIGALAGRRACMDALDGGAWRYGDDSMPEAGVTYFAGTFVRHPLALAAARAVLEHLQRVGPSLQTELNLASAAFVRDANRICRQLRAPLQLAGFSSWWVPRFDTAQPTHELLFPMLRHHGVHALHGFPGYLTTAHREPERQALLEAFGEALADLQRLGLLERRQPVALARREPLHANPAAAGAARPFGAAPERSRAAP